MFTNWWALATVVEVLSAILFLFLLLLFHLLFLLSPSTSFSYFLFLASARKPLLPLPLQPYLTSLLTCSGLESSPSGCRNYLHPCFLPQYIEYNTGSLRERKTEQQKGTCSAATTEPTTLFSSGNSNNNNSNCQTHAVCVTGTTLWKLTPTMRKKKRLARHKGVKSRLTDSTDNTRPALCKIGRWAQSM